MYKRQATALPFRAIPRYFDTQPTAKQLEEYHQLGWEFICTYRCKGYLLANITEHPQEPYTDPAVQKKNIEELYQEERYLYLAGMVLGTLFFVGLGLLTWHYFCLLYTSLPGCTL